MTDKREKNDLVTKNFEAFPDVAADIINALLHNGENVVTKENLMPAPTESIYEDKTKMLRNQLEDVAKYVDRLIVMNQGEVRFDGRPVDVFRHYKELEAIGLAAPQVTYLVHDLKEKGLDIDNDITTVAEAKAAILALWDKKRKRQV